MKFHIPPYSPPDFTKDTLKSAPDAQLLPAPVDMTAPEGYHATTIYPEYIKYGGCWHLIAESRMDCVAVYENEVFKAREFRRLKRGDLIVIGRSEDGHEGILVHPGGFGAASGFGDSFAFRLSRSRETAFSIDYDFLYDLLRYERDFGYVVWVLGPACSFDADSRTAFASLVAKGYVHALLAGNALATHDLEGAYLNTALGQDIYTQVPYPNGHYHHIDTLNRVRLHGSIDQFIKEEGIRNGIVHACVTGKIPIVLTGSIRDDGPLPEVYADVYTGQDAMREQLSKATTVITLATALHTIASGNMTPSYHVLGDKFVRPVYFYMIDISEFAANKLSDRGSLSSKSIITNVQDFLVHLNNNLVK